MVLDTPGDTAGLALLDHWCEAFPKFRPFAMAYVNNKARKEIIADCFDLAMGVLHDEVKPKPIHLLMDCNVCADLR